MRLSPKHIRSYADPLIDFSTSKTLVHSRASLTTILLLRINFPHALALPAELAQWFLTTLRDRLMKISAEIVCHGRSTTFQKPKLGPLIPVIAAIILVLFSLPTKFEGAQSGFRKTKHPGSPG